MAKTDNLNDFMTDLADSIREATGETESINAQSFSTRITGLGTGKQDKLVSGENIKTINGESVLGSGNISISSGSGTITGVSANGTSVATSGVANIPAATTSKYGVTKLNSSTSSTSTTEAATPSAVKSAYDLANSYKGTVTGVKINGTTKNPSSGVVDLGTVITSHQDISGKQDKLVSGTNIKTINNTSILGSGNISITGGSGTITGVSANGTSVATSGVANIPAATTSKYGVTQLSSSTSSTSTSLAATPSAVKAAYDLAKGKQDKLISGTNIKTINGESLLGSGNIIISGGGSSGGGGGIEWVDLSDYGFDERDYWCATFSDYYGYMQPNKVYVMTSMPVNSCLVEDFIKSNNYVDEYRMIFRSAEYGFVIQFGNFKTHYNVLQDSDLSAEGFKPNTWYDLRLIRTLYKDEEYVLVKAIEFK